MGSPFLYHVGHKPLLDFVWKMLLQQLVGRSLSLEALLRPSVLISDTSAFKGGDQGPGSTWSCGGVWLSAWLSVCRPCHHLSFQRRNGHYVGRTGLKHAGRVSGQLCLCWWLNFPGGAVTFSSQGGGQHPRSA